MSSDANRLGEGEAFPVYERVFVPYIAVLLGADESEERTEALRRVFTFVEEVATSESYYEDWWPKKMQTAAKLRPPGIVQVAVMEPLLFDHWDLLGKAIPFLGPTTRDLLEKAGRLHVRGLPLPNA